MRSITRAIPLLMLLACPTALAEPVIKATPVPPDSIKTFEFKGKPVQVSYKVPKRFIGTFDLTPQALPDMRDQGNLNYKKFARRAVLREDGTGYWHNYGMTSRKFKFEWGIVVEDGKLNLGKYSYRTNDGDRVTHDKVHTLIFHYDVNGKYGYRYFFKSDGRAAIMPLPYHWPMHKQ